MPRLISARFATLLAFMLVLATGCNPSDPNAVVINIADKSIPAGRIQVQALGAGEVQIVADTPFAQGGTLKLVMPAGHEEIYALTLGEQNVLFAAGPGDELTLHVRAGKLAFKSPKGSLAERIASFQAGSDSLNKANLELTRTTESALAQKNDSLLLVTARKREALAVRTDSLLIQSARQNRGSVVGHYIAGFLSPDRHPEALSALLKSLATANITPESKAAVATYSKEFELVRTQGKTLAVGAIAPKLAAPDAGGKMVTVSYLAASYTFVDFWASWCPPCRKANKTLPSVYENFRTKGLQWVQLSTDTSLSDWQFALNVDKLPGTQLREGQGWTGPIMQRFGIVQLPTSILVDSTGRIVARDPDPGQLQALLLQRLP